MKLKLSNENIKTVIEYTAMTFLISVTIYLAMLYIYPQADAALCLATCEARQAAKQKAEEFLPVTETVLTNETTGEPLTVEEYISQAKTIDKNKATYISIILSEVCKLSLKCPTYKYLADMYDNSNRYLSGDFTNKTGEWKRTKPIYPNVFEIYRVNNYHLIIFVDPDDYTRQRSKNIFIEPEIPEYFMRGQGDMKIKSMTLNNGTKIFERIVREDFQISKCHDARMGWSDNGDKLFSNIIAHLYSGCTKDIGQNNTKIIQTKAIEHVDCGPQCQFLQWQKNAIEESKKGFLINPNKTIATNEVKEYEEE